MFSQTTISVRHFAVLAIADDAMPVKIHSTLLFSHKCFFARGSNLLLLRFYTDTHPGFQHSADIANFSDKYARQGSKT